MKPSGSVILSTLVLIGSAGAGFGGYGWSVGHVRRWSGRQDLNFVTCDHCHFVKLERMPWAQPRAHHPSPAGMAVSPDGRHLYIALDDVNEVVEVDTVTRAITRRLTMAGGPFGLALDSQGEHLFVACRDRDQVVSVSTREFTPVESLGVGTAPVALAFCQTKDGPRLVVANSMSDDASVLAVAPLREIARPGTGREPYGVAVSADGKLAFVVSRLAWSPHFKTPSASELTLIDTPTGRVVQRASLASAHLSEAVASVPGRDWELAPLVKVRNLVPITQVANGWVMSSGLAVADKQGRVVQVPLDEANDYFADPSGIAVDAAGRRAYVASGGSDTISVVDLDRLANWLAKADEQTKREAVQDLTLSTEYVIDRLPTARNPRQLAISPDGGTLFVAERLNDSVLEVDTASLKPVGRIVLGDGGADDPIRRGERVFTQAAHTFQRQFSCRSCHPDGHVDGLAYDFDGNGIGDNFLDNRSLQGVAGTEPFKWNGLNPSLEVQCGVRFARVLMRTDPIPPADLKDLTTYLKHLPPPRWERKHNQPLTPAQARGRRLFFATQQPDGTPIPRARQCQTCHRPPLYTDRLMSSVGTQSPDNPHEMFDTPHLLGIAQTAPYLHDGRARTLEEIWTTYQTNDLHGVSSYWNKHQLNDLVEFLKTL
jgi:DNA-binding beta-propeller fold protein YncE